MRYLIKTIFTLLILACCKCGDTQTVSGISPDGQTAFPQFQPNLLPASPDAFSFTRYGNLPIGLTTGTAQFTLPVYTIQSGSLSHNISIGYSSNGVKVDEMATRIGINWNLRAGGVITRTVMDKADDDVAPDFFHGYAAAGEDSWTFYNYVKQANEPIPPDFQPDEYSFNVDGYSGKFLKRENGEFTQFTSSAVKIERNVNGFILTAPTGVKYYFYLSESAKNYSYPENFTFEWTPGLVPTAWYLTKIISPSRDSIVFNYSPVVVNTDSAVNFRNGISQDFSSGAFDYNYQLPTTYQAIGETFSSPPPITTLVQMTDNHPSYLSSVTFKGGAISFIYSGRDDVPKEKKLDSIKVTRTIDGKLMRCYALHYTYSNASATSFDTYIMPGEDYTDQHPDLRKRLFLTSFDDIGNDLQSKQTHSFEYEDINGLPPRLSYSQDRYGSFNNKINGYFFPGDTWFDQFIGYNHFGGDRTYHFNSAKKGILKKISYPTGGFTQFEYEPNKLENDYATIYNRDSIHIEIDTSVYAGQTFVSDTFHFDPGEVRQVQFKVACAWASNPINTMYHGLDTALPGSYHITYNLININTSTCSVICPTTAEPGDTAWDGTIATFLPAGTYRLEATANRAHLRAYLRLIRVRTSTDRSDSSGIAGIRVKSIVDYASTKAFANRRTYIYGDWEDSISSSGTGLLADVNNGNEVSMTWMIGHTYQDPVHDVYCGYNTVHSNSVMSNFLTENNTVFYRKVIELNDAGNGNNNGGTEYEFYYDAKKYSIPVIFNTLPADVWDAWPIVPNNAPNMNNDYRTGSVKSTKIFTYQQKFGTRTILQQSNNYYSLDTSHLVIDTFTVSKQMIKRDISNPGWPYFYDYSIYRYWRYYGFLKQDSIVQKMYANNDSSVSKVVYASYNVQNYKPSLIKYFSSKSDTQNVARKYVPDVISGDPDYSAFSAMKTANIVDPLVQETSSMGNLTTVETMKKRMGYNEFNGIYLPATGYSSQKGNPEYLEISYQQYDSSGNLQQYTGKDGVITSIIWGYNRQYPVAKVVGKTYSDIISQSSINMSVVNNPSSESAMKTELDKLRTVSNVFATTYTYEPLIGIKTQTDPNGRTTYYSYDNFNRLSLVRDQDNNIVKKICYNFQGQPVSCTGDTLAAWTSVSSSCNNGYMIVVEKNMNPLSATYNQTRSVSIASPISCPVCDSITCGGEGKKCFSGICVTGTQVVTSATFHHGLWTVTYHYLWMEDCSISGDYTTSSLDIPLIPDEPSCP